jgi:hypothetical protein
MQECKERIPVISADYKKAWLGDLTVNEVYLPTPPTCEAKSDT